MRLYICPVKPYLDLQGVELVTNARQKKIQAYKQPEDKARSLVAGLLLRQACGVTCDSQIVIGKKGKPYLKNNGMYFNISHSGEYVVLVTANNETGVDIEKIKPYSRAVAKRCFTSEELEWLKNQENDEAFYRLWTAKESIMKGCGLGFSLSPETFCVLPMDETAHSINGKSWFLNWFSYENYILCAAVEGDAEEITIIT